MDLILGVGGSGKTTLGEYLSWNLRLRQYCSKIGKLTKSNNFRFYKLFNFNWFWVLMTPLLTSNLCLFIASQYCLWLINEDSKKIKSRGYDNSIQVSLRSCRVFSYIYSIDKEDQYTSSILYKLKNSGLRFDSVIVLTTNNRCHIERVSKRGYTLFIFDFLILLGDYYEQKYCDASFEFANTISDNVLIIDTTNFEYSFTSALDFLSKSRTNNAVTV
jgi:hypothetical protein